MANKIKNQYLIKEFAALTGTTVRALHHYDQIGLLRPSGRRPNGYRVYTPDDLLRLEQITALKFLGLSLRETRRILEKPSLTVEKSLRVQADIIAEEAQRLERAARAVRQVIGQLETSKKVDFNKIIAIIKEMKEFEEVGRDYTPEQMEAYQKRWAALIEEVKRNLDADPTGPVGQDLARRWKALFDEAYGGHPNLRKRIGEAYRSGAVPAEYQMISPEVWEFIGKASSALGKKGK